MTFDPALYSPPVQGLLQIDRRCSLDGGSPNQSQLPALEALSLKTVFANQPVAASFGLSCLSGLWLLHDYLDRSHRLSQAISTAEGSFWHAIMHRREGDFGNAKYWFRQVGEHPVLDALAAEFGTWCPFEFVDQCQQALDTGKAVEVCVDRQQAEWETLFDWCWQAAIARG